jgi:cell wall-associated NlpC family hydrolase
MAFAVCNVSIMPVRVVSDERSEMVTQVFFGETLQILESSTHWAYVRLTHDRYEGWVDPKQIMVIDEDEMKRISESPLFFSSDLVQVVTQLSNNQLIPLLMGSHLPGISQNRFELAGQEYEYEGATVAANAKPNRSTIIENASMYLNAPYLWGGKSPFGIDCSGYSQTVYKISGLSIPRDASQQALQGETISFITDAQMGDLAFFDNNDGKIIHVGILLGDNKIMHASGKVRVDAIDHQGIFNVDTRKYSHKLRLIKSYLP